MRVIQLISYLFVVRWTSSFTSVRISRHDASVWKSPSISMLFSTGLDDTFGFNDDEEELFPSVSLDHELLGRQDALCQDATHLIAIPLEENKEFMLELESVQRAVLYNCPQLISSVITPGSTKLPLLLVNTNPGTVPTVDGSVSPKSGLPGFDVTKSLAQRMKDDEITQEINRIVQEVVNDVILSRERRNAFKEQDGGNPSNDVDSDYIPEPVMLSFEGLDIEASLHDATVEHETLYVLGKEGKGDMNLMRFVVGEIRARIEAIGWTAGFIPYRPQLDLDDFDMTDAGEDKWRARVPFMRLPPDFEKSLRPVQEGMFGTNMRSPDEGGDGISPLFWFEWRKDEFTPKKYGTRMREIAVYTRTAPSSTYNEYSFYLPRASTLLPTTKSVAVAKVEIDSKAYDDKRQEQNRIADEEAWDSSGEEYSRTRDSLFKDEEDIDDIAVIESTKSSSSPIKLSTPADRTGGARTEKKPIVREYTYKDEDDEKSDLERAKQRIKEKVESIKARSSVETPSRSVSTSQSKKIPTYPSDQHFIGFWRMVTSPLPQTSADADANIFDCDNLILRVDGTISGGPIFDKKLQLRAAGGSWRMFQAKYVGENGEKQGDIQTRLRIEMIIPPRKDKLLIMEGKVSKLALGADVDSSGISSIGTTGNSETILTCTGESYVQDIEGVRRKTGLFSIRKIATPEKVDFVFPVAPPSGIQ